MSLIRQTASGRTYASRSRPPRRRRPRLAPLLLLAAAALAGCAAEGVRVEPPVAVPARFSAEGEAPLPDRWWRALGDEHLSALMEEALTENFSIRQAWDRLDQARAAAEAAGAPLWPSLDGSAGAARTRTKVRPLPRTYATQWTLGLAAAYEVDLWGRVRSTHDAARLDAYATAEDLRAAAITLTAQIARTWIRWAEARAELGVLDEQLAVNQAYLDLIRTRFGQGQGSATDVLQQEEATEAVRGERARLESAAGVLAHQLAVLVGRPPGTLRVAPPPRLPDLPPLPRTGLPAELIGRRPDVRAAALRLQAADRRVWAAVADQFPRISLTATTETSAEAVRDLFDNWLASLAANLTAPLFDAGRRRAEVERTRAALSERLNAYGEAVLRALEEVENALLQEAHQTHYVASLAEQRDLARQAAEQTLANYTKGTMSFERYLSARLTYQRLQRAYLQARRDLALYRVDLYRALAGGWDLPRPARTLPKGPRSPVAPPAEVRTGPRTVPPPPTISSKENPQSPRQDEAGATPPVPSKPASGGAEPPPGPAAADETTGPAPDASKGR